VRTRAERILVVEAPEVEVSTENLHREQVCWPSSTTR
jgi:hypothetical protein